MAWYNPNQLMTKDCLLNFVIGNRGGGKTYGFKKKAITNFLKKGEQFIYLRRYKTELKKISTFFADIKHEFPEHSLVVKGGVFYCDDEIMGYVVPLSTAKQEKSTAYPLVTMIIYDEFLIERKTTFRYLSNEVEEFLDFFETVGRMRENIKAYFIGNAISIVNPYFLYFKIIPDLHKRFNRFNDIMVELYADSDFIEEKKKTRFGRLISEVAYGDYSIENKMKQDNDNFIGKRTPQSRLQAVFHIGQYYYGLWFDFNTAKIYVSNKCDRNYPIRYVFSEQDLDEDSRMAKTSKQDGVLVTICDVFKRGDMVFENQSIKVQCFQALGKLNLF